MRSTHNRRVDLWRNLCRSLLYFVSRVRCRRTECSRSLSHLLMSFLLVLVFVNIHSYASMCSFHIITNLLPVIFVCCLMFTHSNAGNKRLQIFKCVLGREAVRTKWDWRDGGTLADTICCSWFAVACIHIPTAELARLHQYRFATRSSSSSSRRRRRRRRRLVVVVSSSSSRRCRLVLVVVSSSSSSSSRRRLVVVVVVVSSSSSY